MAVFADALTVPFNTIKQLFHSPIQAPRFQTQDTEMQMHRNGSPLDNISTFSTTHTRKQPKPFIELASKQHVVGREMIGVFMTLAFEKV